MQSSALPLGHAASKDSQESFRYNNSRKPISLLIICNGHGEDIIALEIIKRLLKLNKYEKIEAMPLVGKGSAFDCINHNDFKKIGFQQVLPSGGFCNQSINGLILDLKAGVLWYLLKNFLIVRKKLKKHYKLIAIGDLVPLLFASFSRSDFGFIGTPKSDYTWMSGPGNSLLDLYHKWKGSEWDPWEIYLMKSSRCKFIIVRDKITALNLNKKKINASFFGNPMMDFVKDTYKVPENINSYRRIILLIGSRFPEAFRNLERFLCSLDAFKYKSKCLIFVPLSSNADLHKIENYFMNHNFIRHNNSYYLFNEESSWRKKNIFVLLGRNTFSQWANFAEIGLANAGTATEQIAGLGIPSLSLPGDGPQFTKNFAIRQQRLLGGSVIVCEDKATLIRNLLDLLNDEQLRKKQAKYGVLRMGKRGASERIVDYIHLKLSS